PPPPTSTLSLHDALPISPAPCSPRSARPHCPAPRRSAPCPPHRSPAASRCTHPSRHAALARLLAHRRLRPWSAPSTIAIVEDCRSEEHTSELQSRENLVC